MVTILLGWSGYNQKETGNPMAVVSLRTNQINPDKGDGYNFKNFFVSRSIIPSGLKAGKVEVVLDEWKQNLKYF